MDDLKRKDTRDKEIGDRREQLKIGVLKIEIRFKEDK